MRIFYVVMRNTIWTDQLYFCVHYNHTYGICMGDMERGAQKRFMMDLPLGLGGRRFMACIHRNVPVIFFNLV